MRPWPPPCAIFLLANKLEDVDVLGHSMGGKVAMALALDEPALVARVVVADMAMHANTLAMQAVYAQAMLALDLAALHTRQEADDALAANGIADAGIRQFLLKSLARDDADRFMWRFNLKGLIAHFPAIGAAVARDAVFLGPALFVKGALSDYLLPKDEDMILQHFPTAEFATIEGAGHWLHADQPAKFLEIVQGFFGLVKYLCPQAGAVAGHMLYQVGLPAKSCAPAHRHLCQRTPISKF